MDPVRRKSCLLRLRGNCPFRKLLRRTYDVSAANSSPIGSYWNSVAPPTGSQPITQRSQPLPHPCCCQRVSSPDQSEAAADVPMEEETQQNQNQTQHNQTQHNQTQQNQNQQTQQNQNQTQHNQTQHNQTQQNQNQTQQTQQNQTQNQNQQNQTQGNPEDCMETRYGRTRPRGTPRTVWIWTMMLILKLERKRRDEPTNQRQYKDRL